MRTNAESSLPFGFNHVPHDFEFGLGQLLLEKVFIAFRLQPRSAQQVKHALERMAE